MKTNRNWNLFAGIAAAAAIGVGTLPVGAMKHGAPPEHKAFAFVGTVTSRANKGTVINGRLDVTLTPAKGGNVPGAKGLSGTLTVAGRKFRVEGALTPPGTGTRDQGGFGELFVDVQRFQFQGIKGDLTADGDVQANKTYVGGLFVSARQPDQGARGTAVFTPLP